MTRLAVLIFVQMLPATLLTPAVRPLFAGLHGGAEGPMHAFMSLNMIGAAFISYSEHSKPKPAVAQPAVESAPQIPQ